MFYRKTNTEAKNGLNNTQVLVSNADG